MIKRMVLLGCFYLALGYADPSPVLRAEHDQARGIYSFDTQRQSAQFYGLLKELRCLVCQNQDLADSYAPLAKDLRQQVYNKVLAGQSDQEIITYLTARYGDFILFNPPVKPLTWLLWFAPGVFLLLGLVIFIKTTRVRLGAKRD